LISTDKIFFQGIKNNLHQQISDWIWWHWSNRNYQRP